MFVCICTCAYPLSHFANRSICVKVLTTSVKRERWSIYIVLKWISIGKNTFDSQQEHSQSIEMFEDLRWKMNWRCFICFRLMRNDNPLKHPHFTSTNLLIVLKKRDTILWNGLSNLRNTCIALLKYRHYHLKKIPTIENEISNNTNMIPKLTDVQ